MRLKRLSASRFVGLSRWEAQVDAPMVVFFGSNEAGKSTVKELVVGLLFGFSARRKERAPLIGWGAAQATISGELRLNDGRPMTVTRILDEQHASCEVALSGQVQQMGNVPLGAVGAMTREIYESVYGLGRDQMVFPQGAWRQVQDRLLDAAMVERLQPAIAAAQSLEDEAKKIWRPDNRGKPLIRELAEQRIRHKQSLRESRQRQRRLLELQQDYESRRQRMELLRARIRDSEAFLREAAIQRDMKNRLEQIRQMEREAGDLSLFEGLPEDIGSKLRQLDEGIASMSEKLAEDRRQLAELNEVLQSYTQQHRRALEMAVEIENATRLYLQYEEDGRTLGKLREQADKAGNEWRDLVTGLLDSDDTSAISEILEAIDIERLRSASQEALEVSKRVYRAQDTLERTRESRMRHRKMPLIAGILGVLLLLAGAAGLLPLVTETFLYPSLPEPFPLVAGGAAVAGLLSLVLAITGIRPGQRRRIASLEQELAQAHEAMEAAAAAVRAALCGLPIPGERILRADERLTWDVERIRLKHEQLRDLGERLTQIEGRIAENASLISQCVIRCLDRAPGALSDDIAAMNALVSEAREARSRHEAAKQAAERLRRQIERGEDINERAAEERRQLLAALGRVVDGDPAQAIALIARRRDLKRKAQAAREALLADERCASRLARMEAISTQHWPFHDEAVQENQDSVRMARSQLERISGEMGSIEQEIRNLADQPAPGEIQSRIDQIDLAEYEAGLERDRQVLTAAFIRAGRRRFQELHQPDVIRRAGQYMGAITGGRYSRLLMPEDGSGLRVFGAEAGRYLDPEADRLSKGTLGQLYLSLRLAMVDHLDPQEEPLPLLLDEVFTDWDEQRLAQGFRALAGVAQRRQVLLFTCHTWIIERLRAAGAVCRIVTLH
ncbi:MAG: AAA family ATPase [Christensenellales bacterium]|jgi:uncharacterized protein YhaN